MRFSCLGLVGTCVALLGCGGSVQESGTHLGTGGTGQGGAGGSAGSVSKGGAAGAGGTAIEGGTWCYSNESCAPTEWCDLEPAAPGMCVSGGKAGTCRPRPAAEECKVPGPCTNACGCNGLWYCTACDAHVDGVSTTADNQWCTDGGSVQSCGGWGVEACPSDMFCDYPANDPCGGVGSPGVCAPRPSCPDPGGNGACGCDGLYHLSECTAQASGTDVTGGQACMDGGTGTMCGGKTGLVCASDEWCDYEPSNCGAYDNPGICRKRPQGCDDDCPGVCGCDSEFYCNTCSAHAQGIDDAQGSVTCLPPQDGGAEQYSADAWFGGLDHVFVRKADWNRNVCLTIHLASPHQPVAGLSTPDGWGLVVASISNSASDCAGGSTTGDTAMPETVTGTIAFGMGDGGILPCTVSVHVTLGFTSGPSWVYAKELMNADGVTVGGGCL